MINNCNLKDRLLKAYQAYSFAAYDTLLYLDAYPECREAMESYNKYQRMAAKAKAEYEAKFGPVTVPVEAGEWHWANSPWPWQIEGGK